MEHNAINTCKTVISAIEQNLNTKMAEIWIPKLFQYFMYILAKFNVLKTDFTIHYRMETLLFQLSKSFVM